MGIIVQFWLSKEIHLDIWWQARNLDQSCKLVWSEQHENLQFNLPLWPKLRPAVSECRWKQKIGTKTDIWKPWTSFNFLRKAHRHFEIGQVLHWQSSLVVEYSCWIYISWKEECQFNCNDMFICKLDLKVMLDIITLLSNFLLIFCRFHFFYQSI